MKNLITTLLFTLALFFAQTSHAVVAIQTAQQQTTTVQTMKPTTIKDFKKMSTKELETKLGRKLSWKEKLSFKMAKLAPSGGSWWLGFAMGFFLGFIGVIIAYVAFPDERDTIKGSWWGLGAAIILTLLFIGLWALAFRSAIA